MEANKREEGGDRVGFTVVVPNAGSFHTREFQPVVLLYCSLDYQVPFMPELQASQSQGGVTTPERGAQRPKLQVCKTERNANLLPSFQCFLLSAYVNLNDPIDN